MKCVWKKRVDHKPIQALPVYFSLKFIYHYVSFESFSRGIAKQTTFYLAWDSRGAPAVLLLFILYVSIMFVTSSWILKTDTGNSHISSFGLAESCLESTSVCFTGCTSCAKHNEISLCNNFSSYNLFSP